MPNFPEDPFGFRNIEDKDNPKPEELPKEMLVKNTPANERAAEDAVEEGQTDLQAVIDAMDKRLANPELYEDESDDIREKRREAKHLLEARLETIDDFSKLTPEHKDGVAGWVQAVIGGEYSNVYHGENEYDAQSVEGNLGIVEPYRDIHEFISDLQAGFEFTFYTQLDVLDVVPRDVFLGNEGKITSFDLDFRPDPQKNNDRLRKLFPHSNYFEIIYDYSAKNDEHHNFSIRGYIINEAAGEEEVEGQKRLELPRNY